VTAAPVVADRAPAGLRPLDALRRHWPEYLIEGWALGMFMIAAGVAVVLIEHPALPVRGLIADPDLRRGLVGLAMGLTAVALIYSRWGKQSGAHMNPAVTLTFVRLGKVRPIDGLFYVLAQVIGGTLGVLAAYLLTLGALGAPEVAWVVTVPGAAGVAVAFLAELVISLGLMLVVLVVSNTPRLAPLTGLAAGLLVALYITIEAPLSGMSMNPARSLASALPAGVWTAFWIYVAAPVLGMLGAAQLYLVLRPGRGVATAKLCPNHDTRCIHSGFDPRRAQAAST
jgi:aquaporin Z